MADVTVSASSSADGTKVQRFSKDAFREAKESSAWYHYMGESPNHIVQEQQDLKKEKGDRIHVNLVENLDIETDTTNHGRGGENSLEGQRGCSKHLRR